MVVNQIDIRDLTAREAKDDPPVGGDLDCPESGKIAFQTMKSETRQVHVLRVGSLVKTGKYSFDLVNQHPAGYSVRGWGRP